MVGCSALARVSVALVVSMWASAAFSQVMYRCGTGSRAYVTDRPCETGGRSVLGVIGPAPQYPTYNQNLTPSMGQAPDILPYLSPVCAQMNDAVRTGPTRGLKSAAMSELMTNYRRQCGEDEQLAYQRLSEAKKDQREQRTQAQRSVTAEQQRALLSVEQCSQMLGTLASRRKRVAAMTPGELQDLDLFETNYKARCKSG
jgi:hypothetical protein